MTNMITNHCEKINHLQQNADKIRNICILAHVDHGKTTLADSLVATCGIISKRAAGKIRYMDSREDEQERGITMKSSAIALHYKHSDDDYLINVIDSPGHVDFSGEVSTAVRLCDGCVVLVDVVEGVCPQTQVVLRQAYLEKLKPILVFNKIDRLITELQYTPMEAFIHLQNLLEQVNAVTGSLYSVDVIKRNDEKYSDNKQNGDDNKNREGEEWSMNDDEDDDSDLYFSPNEGNVVFTSAVDGWGFRIQQFAELFSAKLGINEKVLRKTLWGDYYVNTKTKRIMKGAQAKGKKPLFVQFILQNLWSVYDAVIISKDEEKAQKVIQSLKIKISTRDAKTFKTEPKSYLTVICSQWLPLPSALLASVCEHVPSPREIIEERVEKLMCGATRKFTSLPIQSQLLKHHFINCDPNSDVIIALVSKMVVVDSKCLPHKQAKIITKEELKARREAARKKYAEMQERLQKGEKQEDVCPITQQQQEDETKVEVTKQVDEEEESKIIAFARVFSGKLHVGQKLFVLGPKHNPSTVDFTQTEEEILENNEHINVAHISSLYNWMGRNVDVCNNAQAGCIIGIGGIEEMVLNSATLSSSLSCPPFNPLFLDSAPILRVAVEPKILSEMSVLSDGLRKLNQADPCVEITIEKSGEHVIAAAGEVHLRRCLEDLQQRFCQIQLNISEPKVPFRETIIPPPKYDVMNELIGGQQKDMLQKWKDDKTKKEKLQQRDDATVTSTETVEITGRKNKDEKIIKLDTANGQASVHVQAVPLPDDVVKLLEENVELIKVLKKMEHKMKDIINRGNTRQPSYEGDQNIIKKEEIDTEANEETIKNLKQFRTQLTEKFGRKKFWTDIVEQIWSFGPAGCGPNILVNRITGYSRPSIWACLQPDLITTGSTTGYRENDQSIVTGFQLATISGPLCEEPLHGVCYVMHEWSCDDVTTTSPTDEDVNTMQQQGGWNSCDNFGPISGQLISTSKEAMRRAFQLQPQRLMAAMYSCSVQSSAEVLGKVHGVLKRREGQILNEDMREGTTIFTVDALIPISQSFGFVDEIRKKTSGLATPQLSFSHWQIIPFDPFWVPTTEEELSHFGEKADFENPALKYMKQVKRRKGLYVEKTVEHAEKQRTITKNK